MWPAHWHSIDGTVVSREEFFRRTTPTQRAFGNKMQQGSGGPTLYATAEEMWADQERIRIENGGDPDYYPPGFVKRMLRDWEESNPDAASPPVN